MEGLSQYAPAAGEAGSTAIYKDSAFFQAWATNYTDYTAGDDVDETWQKPGNALGKAEGTSFDIVSLGRSGSIILTFGAFILNKKGYDFAVFENSFNDSFLELAWVEVSVDGENYVRFPNHSLTASPVSGAGFVDPEKIYGYAGKYMMGYGTPFDLDEVGLDSVYYVKIIDIPGDGSAKDTAGNAIYDPYPTTGSAGFDLDAVGIAHKSEYIIEDEIENNMCEKVKIYPNPFINGIHILKDNGIIEQVVITDLSGREVLHANTICKQHYIELSYLPPGLYFAKIKIPSAIIVKKIIKY